MAGGIFNRLLEFLGIDTGAPARSNAAQGEKGPTLTEIMNGDLAKLDIYADSAIGAPTTEAPSQPVSPPKGRVTLPDLMRADAAKSVSPAVVGETETVNPHAAVKAAPQRGGGRPAGAGGLAELIERDLAEVDRNVAPATAIGADTTPDWKGREGRRELAGSVRTR